MKMFLCMIAATASLAGSALGAAQPELKALKGEIKADGSSTVGPITSAVAEEFAHLAPGVKTKVVISGTGGGFKKFTVGEIDIADASRPIKKEEAEAAAKNKIEYIELPVAFDGLTIVVNKKNTWAKSMTIDQVKKIFVDGNYAKTWKDVDASWPDKPIKLFAPGTDSGTFDYFKEVVAGKDGDIRHDMSVSEDDNVTVKGVKGDENAIGFFGCEYFFENKDSLNAVAIDGGKGPIAVSHETIENGTYAPFSRPLFIYVNKASAARPEVKAFVEFYLANAPTLVEDVKYVKLPADLYARSLANFTAMKTGTQFMNDKGEKVHGPLGTVYK